MRRSSRVLPSTLVTRRMRYSPRSRCVTLESNTCQANMPGSLMISPPYFAQEWLWNWRPRRHSVDARSILVRRDGGAQGCIAGPDDEHVGFPVQEFGGTHGYI